MAGGIRTMTMLPIVSQSEFEGIDGAVLLDVRFYFDGRNGEDEYAKAHIPGAILVGLEDWVSGPATSSEGRHPFPSPEEFARGLASVGIDETTPVIVYDDLLGMVAGRLVWMLRILGQDAALLDGGLANYSGALESGTVAVEPKQCIERPWPIERLLDSDQIAAAIAAGVSTADARGADRYRGEVKGLDARAGHIPDALNLPFSGNLDENGLFLSAAKLTERFVSLGDSPVMHCGSGVSACHNLLALERAGVTDARLYPGSWSAWSSDLNREIATEI